MEFITIPDEVEVFPYPQTFWVLHALNGSQDKFEAQQDLDRGFVDNWPLQLKNPCKKNYRCKPPLMREIRSFFEDLYGSDVDHVHPRITKFGRCEVNGQHFSSDFNSTDRGSIVKVMFVNVDNELTPYYGVVRFYFVATIVVKERAYYHHLAYVHWLKFRSSQVDPLCRLYSVSKDTYQRDTIISPRRFLCRCVLVAPKPRSHFSFVSELLK